jgi:hypothetical protein
MGEWINLATLIAFALGVALSAMIKSWISQAKSKVSDA